MMVRDVQAISVAVSLGYFFVTVLPLIAYYSCARPNITHFDVPINYSSVTFFLIFF